MKEDYARIYWSGRCAYALPLTGLSADRRIMQITAPIQLGNSGGPLLDIAGILAVGLDHHRR